VSKDNNIIFERYMGMYLGGKPSKNHPTPYQSDRSALQSARDVTEIEDEENVDETIANLKALIDDAIKEKDDFVAKTLQQALKFALQRKDIKSGNFAS